MIALVNGCVYSRVKIYHQAYGQKKDGNGGADDEFSVAEVIFVFLLHGL
jgi:hypothetical protein